MYRTWSRFYIKKQRKLCVNLCFVNVPGIATRLHWRLHRRFEEPVGTDGRTKCHPSRLQSGRDGSELPVSRRMGSRAAHSGHRVWSRRKAVLAHHGQGTYRAVLVKGMFQRACSHCLCSACFRLLTEAWCQWLAYACLTWFQCLLSMADLRDSHRFAYQRELDAAFSVAVRKMGPRVVLGAVPLQITGEK